MKKKIIILLALGLLLVIYLLVSQKYNIAIPCVFYKITGLYCPGCGITRSFQSALHLDFYQAFRYNPAVFFLLPLFLLTMMIDYILIKRKKLKKSPALIRYTYNTIAVMLLVYGVVRNIPYFSFLQPIALFIPALFS